MILRRFVQHVKEQNWFAVGLDVIVVIVGIFLGMQVTEWNDNRLNEQKGESYLQRIIVDLDKTIEIQDMIQAIFYEQRMVLFNTYKDIRSTHEISEEQMPDFVSGISNIEIGLGSEVHLSTIQEILNAGDLEIISDDDSRIAIGQFVDRYDRLLFALKRNRQDSQSSISKVLAKIDLGYGKANTLMSPRLDVNQIRSDPEISAMISIIMWNQHDMHKLYIDIHNEVILLRNIIAKALNKEQISEHLHQIGLDGEGDKRF